MTSCSDPAEGSHKVAALFERYKKWIVSNPRNLSDMEAIVRWGSYLLAGRFQHSSLLCELLSSGARLFELFNDMLLHWQVPQFTLQQEKKIQFLLCVLESVEVVAEVGAQQVWGDVGRWAVVATIQLMKLMWRFILLFRKKMSILPCTSESPVSRAVCLKLISNNNSSDMCPEGGQGSSAATFLDVHRKSNETKLPHSGYVMRAVHSLPPPHLRSFAVTQRQQQQQQPAQSPRSSRRLAAEVMYALRPASHLTCSYFFGLRSWVPYFVSLVIDVGSLELHRRNALLTAQERQEVQKRYRTVLLYLLRCPAYERVTKRRLEAVLSSVGSTVPFTHQLCQSMVRYVNYWQQLYGHSWST